MAPLTALSDEQLLQVALQGDEQAWRELVSRYQKPALYYVLGEVHDEYQAKDIVQIHWRALLRSVRKDPPRHFSAFFWTALKRRVIDWRREQGRNREDLTLDAPLSADEESGITRGALLGCMESTPEEHVVKQEQNAELHRAIDQLSLRDQYVVRAKALEDRSYDEIVEVLIERGWMTPEGDVRKNAYNYYGRALRKLNEILTALDRSEGGASHDKAD